MYLFITQLMPQQAAHSNSSNNTTTVVAHNFLLFQISNSHAMIIKPSHYHTTSPHIHTFNEKSIHLFHKKKSTKYAAGVSLLISNPTKI